MALSINQILAATKVDGLELAKIKSDGGNYFLAILGDHEHSIYVNSIGQMSREAWVDELRGFAAGVATEEAAKTADAPSAKPLAVKIVKHVDGSVSIFIRRKLVETFSHWGRAVDSFLAFHFGDHEPHVRIKEARASKRQPKK